VSFLFKYNCCNVLCFLSTKYLLYLIILKYKIIIVFKTIVFNVIFFIHNKDQILSEVKVKVVRDFLFDILKPVTRFGKNLFELMVGSGRHAQCVLGAIHVCVVGGDGKELDLLCGCQHSRRRNCRMCLEWRHNLFTRPTQNSEIRLDSVHEQVSYDLVELNKRIFAGIYDGGRKKRYIKSPEDRILLQRGQTYCIQAGESKLYRLFYHFNSVGISSLHTSVFPDMLHVVLKGIIEKTLAGVLLVVNTSQKLFDKKSYGNAMGLLDFRTSRMAPVHNLDWMRWVSFSNGLSQILKTESRSAAKSDNSTGILVFTFVIGFTCFHC